MMGEGGSLYSRTLVRAIRVSVIPESFFFIPVGVITFSLSFFAYALYYIPVSVLRLGSRGCRK